MNIQGFQVVKYDKFNFKIINSLLFDHSHIWYDFQEQTCVIGITDYLQQTIGDVAFISVKNSNELLIPGKKVFEIETMKVTLELTLPFQGIISDQNLLLEDNPEYINDDPYGDGWILHFEPSDIQEAKTHLMNADEYATFIKGEAEKSKKD